MAFLKKQSRFVFMHSSWTKIFLSAFLVLILLSVGFWMGQEKREDLIGWDQNFSEVSSEEAYFKGELDMASSSIAPRDFPVPSSGDLSEYSSVETKIIRTANLSLLVENTEEFIPRVQTMVEGFKGFVEYSSTWVEVDETTSGTMTLRVPSKDFSSAMESIKKMATVVKSESVSGQNVTEEYIDLQARLKTLQAEEAQYLAILERASTVEEILKVTDYLSNVRAEIESLQGRLQYLENQTDYSTITLAVYEEASLISPTENWQPVIVFKEAFNQLIQFARWTVEALIWVVVFAGPVLVFFGLIYSIWRFLAPKK
jgi:hypothetical protein